MPRRSARRAGLAGVPERVLASLEHLGEVGCCRTQAFGVEDFGVGHLYVEIVLLEGVADHFALPHGEFIGRHKHAERSELGGPAERDADDFSRPCAADSVAELGHGELTYRVLREKRRGEERNEDDGEDGFHAGVIPSAWRPEAEPRALEEARFGNGYW